MNATPWNLMRDDPAPMTLSLPAPRTLTELEALLLSVCSAVASFQGAYPHLDMDLTQCAADEALAACKAVVVPSYEDRLEAERDKNDDARRERRQA